MLKVALLGSKTDNHDQNCQKASKEMHIERLKNIKM